MNSIFRSTLIWLSFCLPLIAAPPPSPDKKPQPIKGWGEITDPDGDCRVAEDKGDLTITVPKTHHDLTYTEKYTKLNGPRVLQPVEGDFTLEVKVRAFPPPGNVASSGGQYSFVSAGLLIWQDEKNFIRMERAAVGNSDTPFVWIERFADGKASVQKMKRLSDKATGLRVVRKGNQFAFLYDEDGEGKTWVEAHSGEIEMPAKLDVGVATINSTVREFPVRLTGLKLAVKK